MSQATYHALINTQSALSIFWQSASNRLPQISSAANTVAKDLLTMMYDPETVAPEKSARTVQTAAAMLNYLQRHYPNMGYDDRADELVGAFRLDRALPEAESQLVEQFRDDVDQLVQTRNTVRGQAEKVRG